jgi:hypothetical protein
LLLTATNYRILTPPLKLFFAGNSKEKGGFFEASETGSWQSRRNTGKGGVRIR